MALILSVCFTMEQKGCMSSSACGKVMVTENFIESFAKKFKLHKAGYLNQGQEISCPKCFQSIGRHCFFTDSLLIVIG